MQQVLTPTPTARNAGGLRRFPWHSLRLALDCTKVDHWEVGLNVFFWIRVAGGLECDGRAGLSLDFFYCAVRSGIELYLDRQRSSRSGAPGRYDHWRCHCSTVYVSVHNLLFCMAYACGLSIWKASMPAVPMSGIASGPSLCSADDKHQCREVKDDFFPI